MAADIEMGFKVTYRGEKRRFPAPSDTTMESLTAQVRRVFCLPEERELVFTYEDEDEDMVTFSTTDELREGMRLAKSSMHTTTMIVIVSERGEQPTAASHPPRPRPEPSPPPHTHAPPPQPFQSPSSSSSSFSSSSSDWPRRHERRNGKFEERTERRLQHNDFKEQKRQIRHQWKQEKREEKQIAKDKEYAARFVAHVTIPDMSCLSKGSAFTKTWRFRNEGSRPWPQDTHLLFISKQMGDLMGAEECVVLPHAVGPGEEVDVSVHFTAPGNCGQYCGYWRLALPNGRKFGQRVWCRIQVVD